jgi:hypothetical protein
MKQIKIYIAVLCMAMSLPAFGSRTTLKEHTDNWLRSSNGEEAPTTDDKTPPPLPEVANPVGDATWIPLLLGLSYGIYILGKRRKEDAPLQA